MMTDICQTNCLEEEINDWIGERVCINGTKSGVVRYFGKTHFGEGVWCGVALDNALGKHNGTVDGVQYFSCKENHGVLVPQYKIAKLATTNFTDSGKLNETDRNLNSKLPSRIRFRKSTEIEISGGTNDNMNREISSKTGMVKPRRQSDCFGGRFSSQNTDLNSINNNVVESRRRISMPLNTSYTSSDDRPLDFLNKTITLGSFREELAQMNEHDVNPNETFSLFEIDNMQLNATYNANVNDVKEGTFILDESMKTTLVSEEDQVVKDASGNKDSPTSDLNDSLGLLSLTQMKDFSFTDENDFLCPKTELSCIAEVASFQERESSIFTELPLSSTFLLSNELNAAFLENTTKPPEEFVAANTPEVEVMNGFPFGEMAPQSDDTNTRHSTPKDLALDLLGSELGTVHQEKVPPSDISPIVPNTRESKIGHASQSANKNYTEERIKEVHLNLTLDLPGPSGTIPEGDDISSKVQTITNNVEQIENSKSESNKEPTLLKLGEASAVEVESTNANSPCSSNTSYIVSIPKSGTFNVGDEEQKKIRPVPRSISAQSLKEKNVVPTTTRKSLSAMNQPSTAKNVKSRLSVGAPTMPKKNVVSKIKSMLSNTTKNVKPVPTSPTRRPNNFSLFKRGNAIRMDLNPICHSTPKSPNEGLAGKGPNDGIAQRSALNDLSPMNFRDVPKVSVSNQANKTDVQKTLSQESRVLTQIQNCEIDSKKETKEVFKVPQRSTKGPFKSGVVRPSSPASSSSKPQTSASSKIVTSRKISSVPTPPAKPKTVAKSELKPPSFGLARATGGSFKVAPKNEERENNVVRRTSIPRYKPPRR